LFKCEDLELSTGYYGPENLLIFNDVRISSGKLDEQNYRQWCMRIKGILNIKGSRLRR
jgi:hypothetical protein